MVTSNEQTALVPIAEALPELRAEQYAKVREWDAARMALEGEYEAADGEYLKLIRDSLKDKHGLWTAYLRARGIPDSTARDRIRRAEGRYVPYVPSKLTSIVGLPEPPASPQDTVIVPKEELARLEHIEAWAQDAGYDGEDADAPLACHPPMLPSVYWNGYDLQEDHRLWTHSRTLSPG